MKNIQHALLAGLFLSLATLLSAQSSGGSSCPCCQPEFRQFDFWVGDWETFNPGDTLVGTNRIVILQDSCVIQENWISARGAYTGTSYNFYDPQTGKWRQTWIDNQGASLFLSGGLEDGKMVLYSEKMKNSQGQDYLNRITWTPNPDGSVRQRWEVSSDDGQTWRGVFDGIYRHKK